MTGCFGMALNIICSVPCPTRPLGGYYCERQSATIVVGVGVGEYV